MKKLISLVLILALTAALTVNAFADRASGGDYTLGVIKTSGSTVSVDNSKNGGTSDFGDTTIGNSQIIKNTGVYIGYNDGSGTYKPVLKSDKHYLTVEMRNTKNAKAIKSAEIRYDSNNRAYIALVLNENMDTVDEISFVTTLNLRYNGKRLSGPEYTVEGTLSHKSQDVYSHYDKVYIDEGKILSGKGNVTKLEIVLNDSVSLFSRIASGQKYFASISEDLVSDSDYSIYDKYTDIVAFYEIKQLKLAAAQVKFDLGSNYYVYALDSSGNLIYLGRSQEQMPLYSKYFIASRQLTISGSSSSSSSTPSTPPTPSTPSTTTASAITTTAATNAGKTAATTARSQGLSTATVTLRNVESASKEALWAMSNAAAMTTRLNADVLNTAGTGVDIRITLNPAYATKDLKLMASSYSEQAKATKAFFERWFSNKMLCISFTHQGSFGQTMQVAAKISTTGMDTTKLKFYSYNRATNTYTPITTPNYKIDANGFIHFSTSYGGDMMISEGALVRK